MLIRTSTLVVCSLVMLTACSSSSNKNDTTEDESGVIAENENNDVGGNNTVALAGSVNVVVNSSLNDVEITGTFFELESALPAATLLEEARPSQDRCVVSMRDDSDVADNTVAGTTFQTISAGEVITVNSPAGTYAELIRTQFAGFTVYDLAEGVSLPAPPPENLTVDIPGDAFPAVSNVSLPNIVPFTFNSSTTELTPDTTFSWNASGNPDARISLYSYDFTTGEELECTLLDDGTFSFDANTQAAMGTSFSGSIDAERGVIQFQDLGEAVLVTVGSTL